METFIEELSSVWAEGDIVKFDLATLRPDLTPAAMVVARLVCHRNDLRRILKTLAEALGEERTSPAQQEPPLRDSKTTVIIAETPMT